MTTTKTRLLSHFYLVSLAISLPLLFCLSSGVRDELRRFGRGSFRRYVRLLRLVAKTGAQILGATILGFILLPAAVAYGGAMFTGQADQALRLFGEFALFGFVGFTLIPVLAPLPSRDGVDTTVRTN